MEAGGPGGTRPVSVLPQQRVLFSPAHTGILVLGLLLLFLSSSSLCPLIFLKPNLIPKQAEVLALTWALHSTAWEAAPGGGYFLVYSIT